MTRHYFVDYEVYSGGLPMLQGQLAMSWATAPGVAFAAEDLLAQARQKAADRHGAEAQEIQIKALTRL